MKTIKELHEQWIQTGRAVVVRNGKHVGYAWRGNHC